MIVCDFFKALEIGYVISIDTVSFIVFFTRGRRKNNHDINWLSKYIQHPDAMLNKMKVNQ